jgi:hypothetical protein
MSVEQPTTEQVLAALELNGVSVVRIDRHELQPDGSLLVQIDHEGGVLLPRPDWAPSRLCNGGAECVGQTVCPRRHQCHE